MPNVLGPGPSGTPQTPKLSAHQTGVRGWGPMAIGEDLRITTNELTPDCLVPKNLLNISFHPFHAEMVLC